MSTISLADVLEKNDPDHIYNSEELNNLIQILKDETKATTWPDTKSIKLLMNNENDKRWRTAYGVTFVPPLHVTDAEITAFVKSTKIPEPEDKMDKKETLIYYLTKIYDDVDLSTKFITWWTKHKYPEDHKKPENKEEHENKKKSTSFFGKLNQLFSFAVKKSNNDEDNDDIKEIINYITKIYNDPDLHKKFTTWWKKQRFEDYYKKLKDSVLFEKLNHLFTSAKKATNEDIKEITQYLTEIYNDQNLRKEFITWWKKQHFEDYYKDLKDSSLFEKINQLFSAAKKITDSLDETEGIDEIIYYLTKVYDNGDLNKEFMTWLKKNDFEKYFNSLKDEILTWLKDNHFEKYYDKLKESMKIPKPSDKTNKTDEIIYYLTMIYENADLIKEFIAWLKKQHFEKYYKKLLNSKEFKKIKKSDFFKNLNKLYLLAAKKMNEANKTVKKTTKDVTDKVEKTTKEVKKGFKKGLNGAGPDDDLSLEETSSSSSSSSDSESNLFDSDEDSDEPKMIVYVETLTENPITQSKFIFQDLQPIDFLNAVELGAVIPPPTNSNVKSNDDDRAYNAYQEYLRLRPICRIYKWNAFESLGKHPYIRVKTPNEKTNSNYIFYSLQPSEFISITTLLLDNPKAIQREKTISLMDAEKKFIQLKDANDPDYLTQQQILLLQPGQNKLINRDPFRGNNSCECDRSVIGKKNNEAFPMRYIIYTDTNNTETKVYEHFDPKQYKKILIVSLEKYRKKDPSKLIGITSSDSTQGSANDPSFRQRLADLAAEQKVKIADIFVDPDKENTEIKEYIPETVQLEDYDLDKYKDLNETSLQSTLQRELDHRNQLDLYELYIDNLKKLNMAKIKYINDEKKSDLLPESYSSDKRYFDRKFIDVYDRLLDLITNHQRPPTKQRILITKNTILHLIVAIFHVYGIFPVDYVEYESLLKGLQSYELLSSFHNMVWPFVENIFDVDKLVLAEELKVIQEENDVAQQLQTKLESLDFKMNQVERRSSKYSFNYDSTEITVRGIFTNPSSFDKLFNTVITINEHPILKNSRIVYKLCAEILEIFAAAEVAAAVAKPIILSNVNPFSRKTDGSEDQINIYKKRLHKALEEKIGSLSVFVSSIRKFVDPNQLKTAKPISDLGLQNLGPDGLKLYYPYIFNTNTISDLQDAFKQLYSKPESQTLFDYIEVDNNFLTSPIWQYTYNPFSNTNNNTNTSLSANVIDQLHECDYRNTEFIKYRNQLEIIRKEYSVYPTKWTNEETNIELTQPIKFELRFKRLIQIAQDANILPRGLIGCKFVPKHNFKLNNTTVYAIVVQYFCFTNDSILDLNEEWRDGLKQSKDEPIEIYVLRLQYNVVTRIQHRIQRLLLLQAIKPNELLAIKNNLANEENSTIRNFFNGNTLNTNIDSLDWYYKWPNNISIKDFSITFELNKTNQINENINKDSRFILNSIIDNINNDYVKCFYHVSPFDSGAELNCVASSIFHSCSEVTALRIFKYYNRDWFYYHPVETYKSIGLLNQEATSDAEILKNADEISREMMEDPDTGLAFRNRWIAIHRRKQPPKANFNPLTAPELSGEDLIVKNVIQTTSGINISLLYQYAIHLYLISNQSVFSILDVSGKWFKILLNNSDFEIVQKFAQTLKNNVILLKNEIKINDEQVGMSIEEETKQPNKRKLEIVIDTGDNEVMVDEEKIEELEEAPLSNIEEVVPSKFQKIKETNETIIPYEEKKDVDIIINPQKPINNPKTSFIPSKEEFIAILNSNPAFVQQSIKYAEQIRKLREQSSNKNINIVEDRTIPDINMVL